MAFDDHVLAEHFFESESETFNGAHGGLVLLFEASVPEPEHVVSEEEQGFGGPAGPHRRGPPEDIADLDDPVSGIDAHQRLPSHRVVGALIDDGEEHRICLDGDTFGPAAQIRTGGRGTLRLVSEALLGVGPDCGLEQVLGVALGVQRL